MSKQHDGKEVLQQIVINITLREAAKVPGSGSTTEMDPLVMVEKAVNTSKHLAATSEVEWHRAKRRSLTASTTEPRGSQEQSRAAPQEAKTGSRTDPEEDAQDARPLIDPMAERDGKLENDIFDQVNGALQEIVECVSSAAAHTIAAGSDIQRAANAAKQEATDRLNRAMKQLLELWRNRPSSVLIMQTMLCNTVWVAVRYIATIIRDRFV